jgi:hypothetical protein
MAEGCHRLFLKAPGFGSPEQSSNVSQPQLSIGSPLLLTSDAIVGYSAESPEGTFWVRGAFFPITRGLLRPDPTLRSTFLYAFLGGSSLMRFGSLGHLYHDGG